MRAIVVWVILCSACSFDYDRFASAPTGDSSSSPNTTGAAASSAGGTGASGLGGGGANGTGADGSGAGGSGASSSGGQGAAGGGPAPTCGDGVVTGDEECDDADWAPNLCSECKTVCVAPSFEDPATGHCYELITSPKQAWTQARTACATWRVGADLASLETLAEHNAIASQLNGTLYICAQDMDDDGTFQWCTGGVLGAAYNNWRSGEPQSGNEPCVGFYQGGNAWHNFTCTPLESYLCEWSGAR